LPMPERPPRLVGVAWGAVLSVIAALAVEVFPPAPGPPRARAPAAQASKAPARLEPFSGRLEPALALAKERNVPVLIIAILEGEAQNDETRTKVLVDPALVAASPWTVTLVSNNGTHPQKSVEVLVNGKTEKRSVCSAYGTPSCNEHRVHWDEIYNAYNENGELRCPQALVVMPDGKIFQRISPGDVPPVAKVVEAIEAARKSLGPGITDAQLAELKADVERARGLQKVGNHGAAWKAWNASLEILATGGRADEARRELAVCLAALQTARDKALAALQGPKPAEGYAQLVALREACEGIPLALEIARLIKDAESDPRTKGAIATYKREQAAEALWLEAMKLLDDKKEKPAERKVRQLLKKFRDTPAGERAAQRWPDWAREEAAG
jgi:hypothetical protein